jgi:hypothetical protein
MTEKDNGPHGVGGWLALLVAGRVVLGPLSGIGRTYGELAAAESEYPALAQIAEWSSFKTVEWVALLIFCAISIYGGLGLAAKRTPDAVSKAKLVLWFNYPLSIIVTAMIIPATMIPDSGKQAAMAVPSLFGSLIAVAIWTAYLNRSKRVKNTYGLGDESPVAQVSATAYQVSRTNNPAVIWQQISAPPPNATQKMTNSNEEGSEKLWAQALAELEGGNRRSGLWAKAFADAQGNEAAAKANYLRDRVCQLSEENRSRTVEVRQHKPTASPAQNKRRYDATGVISTITAALVVLWVIVLAGIIGWAIIS